MEKRLNRNATTIETHTTNPLCLNHRHLFPQLGKPDGRDITGGSSTDYHDIKSFCHHLCCFYLPERAFNQFGGDDQPLDLVGALVNLGDFRIPHHLFYRKFLHIAIATKYLDHIGGDPHRGI